MPHVLLCFREALSLELTSSRNDCERGEPPWHIQWPECVNQVEWASIVGVAKVEGEQ